MKVDTPVIDPELSAELVIWVQQVSDLLNLGFYQPKVFTTAPTLAQMNVGELAVGNATGASSEHEIFWKLSSTTIARWTHDATIT